MTTNLNIDTALLEEAHQLGGFSTKKETVNEALISFVQHKKQLNDLELAETFEEIDEFDYKAYRKDS